MPARGRLLSELERLHAEFGPGHALRKRALLATLGRTRLRGATQVRRFHDALCFLRAYPDDAALLALVERLLEGFAARPDVRAARADLADSGIAGTDAHYPFFAAMALWLAARWGDGLVIDRDDWNDKDEETLLRLLPLIAHYAESPGMDDLELTGLQWLDAMRGRETDGAFLARSVAALARGDAFLDEYAYEALQPPLILRGGPDTPSRTRALHRPTRGATIHYQTEPLQRARPELPAALAARPRAVRAVTRAEGRALIDLAREAMVVRSRDLDVFAWGDSGDVRLVDWGEGLQFACIGFIPERRLLLESVYGFLTLKNGVPIGYVLISAILGSSEIAYNIFETWRGGEAARIYGRVLATARTLFGSDSFAIYPYQLGDDNDEALQSGAWWFYQKLGFRPRDPGVLAVMRRELARMRRSPRHRSSIATLRRLAAHNVYYHQGPARDDVIGLAPLASIGLAVTRSLGARFGSERLAGTRGARACEREAAALLGVRGARGARGARGGGALALRGWSAGERLAFERWAPLVTLLPGLAGWSAADRRALLAVIRAKGGPRESDYVRLLDRHRPLRRALLALARATPAS
jgi:hypothetical protein